MTDGEHILDLIESLHYLDIDGFDYIDEAATLFFWDMPITLGAMAGLKENYTRNLNALKNVRPKNWHFDIISSIGSKQSWKCCLRHNKHYFVVESPDLQTEGLAILHATIQAIMWERDNDKHNQHERQNEYENVKA